MQISKSRYCRGIQCPKMIWMDRYMPEEAVSTANEAVLENGTRVGQLALELFPGCVTVPFSLVGAEMAEATRKLLDDGAVSIAEASFYFEDLFCSVDILRRRGDGSGFDIFEVKSSTGVTDIYLEDLAFQYYVLTHAGLKINRAYIVHLNSAYTRQGELDLERLFYPADCTDEVLALQEKIPRNVEALRYALNMKQEPKWDIGMYCDTPYECAYKQYCGKHLPSPSVFDINGMYKSTKYELYHKGALSYGDILNCEDFKARLKKNELRQVEAEYYHNPDFIDKGNIKEFLETLQYPVYHLDFETYQQSIPLYDGVRPYMQIPFQYSLHVQKSAGAQPQHFEYLGETGKDPRRGLAEQLCRDIPKGVCVLAYNMGFEKGRIKELAQMYPDLAEHLMDIHNHIVDLMEPFRKKHYYSEHLHGSYSIKYVLPALCPGDPELNYDNLEGVHNGAEAMNAFARLTDLPEEEQEAVRKNLLAYCRLDTLAMVKILDKLWYMIA